MQSPTFLLVHSPLVGPATWHWVAEALSAAGHRTVVPSLTGISRAEAPYWPFVGATVASAMQSANEEVVLVGHSGAGPLLPMIASRLASPPRAYVFVDAGLPAEAGETPLASPEFFGFLQRLARDGELPPWSEWWPAGTLERLVPDPSRRAIIERELPRLRLDYFQSPVPVPDEWSRASVAYLLFSPAYEAEAHEARRRGFVVETMPGGHLHMVMEPEAVADRLIYLCGRLGIDIGR